MKYIIDESWAKLLKDKLNIEYKRELFTWLENEYFTKTIYPPKEKIFNALNLVPPQNVKVVILGQDPYPTPGQADGLAFSCHNGTQQPSLKNIVKEIAADLNIPLSNSADLTPWAKQGVLLLNTSLTVEKNNAGSSTGGMWMKFTTAIMQILNELNQPIVFLLWGNHAKGFAKYLNNPNHLILTSAHPSGLSAYKGFFGNKHFSKCNQFLSAHAVNPINWQL